MRKWITALLTLAMLLSCGVTAFAADTATDGDSVDISVYAKAEYNIDGEYTAVVEDGAASVTTPDGTVSVTNAPASAVLLVVIPMEGEALTWIDSCVDGDAKTAYDIHFVDAQGNRINANGARVSITVSGSNLTVSSVTISGTEKSLTAEVSGGKVSFTTDGSHYYALAEKADGSDERHVTVNDPEGGDAEISNPTPETGDTVTITPTPDEGKAVDEVIVKDKDGNPIPVTDNGDGTYTYEQPDGDVSIEVTFKDEEPAPAEEYNVTIQDTSGGDVAVSDMTLTAGRTVTITPKPDNGKVVNEVIVTDENGKTVRVTDNGDGTYSYTQPDGDVTIKVTFKNKPSSDNPGSPATGDNSNIVLWSGVLILSALILVWIILGKRRKNENKG